MLCLWFVLFLQSSLETTELQICVVCYGFLICWMFHYGWTAWNLTGCCWYSHVCWMILHQVVHSICNGTLLQLKNHYLRELELNLRIICYLNLIGCCHFPMKNGEKDICIQYTCIYFFVMLSIFCQWLEGHERLTKCALKWCSVLLHPLELTYCNILCR